MVGYSLETTSWRIVIPSGMNLLYYCMACSHLHTASLTPPLIPTTYITLAIIAPGDCSSESMVGCSLETTSCRIVIPSGRNLYTLVWLVATSTRHLLPLPLSPPLILHSPQPQEVLVQSMVGYSLETTSCGIVIPSDTTTQHPLPLP